MSKKNRKPAGAATTTHMSAMSHAAEYRIIKFDLVKVVILNIFYLAVILGLYYSNLRSGFLDSWFAKVLHF